jgi:hypothetical protein
MHKYMKLISRWFLLGRKLLRNSNNLQIKEFIIISTLPRDVQNTSVGSVTSAENTLCSTAIMEGPYMKPHMGLVASLKFDIWAESEDSTLNAGWQALPV